MKVATYLIFGNFSNKLTVKKKIAILNTNRYVSFHNIFHLHMYMYEREIPTISQRHEYYHVPVDGRILVDKEVMTDLFPFIILPPSWAIAAT